MVVLKSGGPKMTLSNKLEGTTWLCQWFVGTKPHDGAFQESSFRNYDPYGEDRPPRATFG